MEQKIEQRNSDDDSQQDWHKNEAKEKQDEEKSKQDKDLQRPFQLCYCVRL